MKISNPLFTDTHLKFVDFCVPPHSAYIFSTSDEKRSLLPQEWVVANSAAALFIESKEISNSISFTPSVGEKVTVALRSSTQLLAFFEGLDADSVYIDITGMGYGLWAPLLKSALQSTKNIKCLYTEPRSYTFSDVPTDGTIFDLSLKINGISPLPGFSNFRDAQDELICFIPFLGFEGARFRFALETEEPGPYVFPVIGVPGYQPEYPFHSFLGNKNVLVSDQIWKNVRYVPAHCPFSVYRLLEELREEYPNHFLKLAPIGSKPHGLGAILFAIRHHECCEIIYDNPIRKAGRTDGKSRVHIYNITDFLA